MKLHWPKPLQPRWMPRFVRIAEEVASWSKDPSTKVGCVLVDEQCRVVGTGYNGFPRGIQDDPLWLEQRDVKLTITIHAEENAMFNAVAEVGGTYAFVTHAPCAACVSRMVQNGVVGAAYPVPEGEFAERWAESYALSRSVAYRAGLKLYPYTKKPPHEGEGFQMVAI